MLESVGHTRALIVATNSLVGSFCYFLWSDGSSRSKRRDDSLCKITGDYAALIGVMLE